jgi:hypothetical protein
MEGADVSEIAIPVYLGAVLCLARLGRAIADDRERPFGERLRAALLVLAVFGGLSALLFLP